MKTKLALIFTSVLLASSLSGNAYFYAIQQHTSAEYETLEGQAADLKNQLAVLVNQKEGLQNRNTRLETQIAALENQIAGLKNQTDNMEKENVHIYDENRLIQNQIDQTKQTGFPKIVTRLGATDIRSSPAPGHPWSGIVRFYISGEVWNMGTGPACNCKLHVTLYQGEHVANDTFEEIGTIAAGSYVQMTKNIYYTGEALTEWTIIPEYA